MMMDAARLQQQLSVSHKRTASDSPSPTSPPPMLMGAPEPPPPATSAPMPFPIRCAPSSLSEQALLSPSSPHGGLGGGRLGRRLRRRLHPAADDAGAAAAGHAVPLVAQPGGPHPAAAHPARLPVADRRGHGHAPAVHQRAAPAAPPPPRRVLLGLHVAGVRVGPAAAGLGPLQLHVQLGGLRDDLLAAHQHHQPDVRVGGQPPPPLAPPAQQRHGLRLRLALAVADPLALVVALQLRAVCHVARAAAAPAAAAFRFQPNELGGSRGCTFGSFRGNSKCNCNCKCKSKCEFRTTRKYSSSFSASSPTPGAWIQKFFGKKEPLMSTPLKRNDFLTSQSSAFNPPPSSPLFVPPPSTPPPGTLSSVPSPIPAPPTHPPPLYYLPPRSSTRQRAYTDFPQTPSTSPPNNNSLYQPNPVPAPPPSNDMVYTLLCDKYAWPCLRYHTAKHSPHPDALCDVSFAHDCTSSLNTHSCTQACSSNSSPVASTAPSASTNLTHVENTTTGNTNNTNDDFTRYCSHALEDVYYRYESQLSLKLREKAIRCRTNIHIAVKSFVLCLEMMAAEIVNSFLVAYPAFTPKTGNGLSISSPGEDSPQSLATSGDQRDSFTDDRVGSDSDGNDAEEESPLTRLHLATTQKVLICSPESITSSCSVKRGSCSTSLCECDQYYGTVYGGVCQNCGHSPTVHENMGPVDSILKSTSQTSGPSLDDFPLPTTTHSENRLAVSDSEIRTLSIITKHSATQKSNPELAKADEHLLVSPVPSLASSNPEQPSPLIHQTSIDQGNPSHQVPRSSDKTEPATQQSPLNDAKQWAIPWSEIKQHIEKKPFGNGSFAKLYKGVWRNQCVAVKVLKDKPDKRAIQDFKKEFSLLSELRSPNIVYFYGAVLEPRVCLVLEYCSRGSLETVMKSDASFTWEHVFQYAADTLRGLLCLHSWVPQLLHRDLKSSNVLLADNGAAKLCDFGTTRINDDSDTLYQVRGTYAYSCPEVFIGGVHTDKSDIFSFSILLWEMVTRCIKGEYVRPYSEYTMIQVEFQILVQVAQKGIRPTIPSSCPHAMSSIIQHCWSASPYMRPSCSEAQHWLEEAQVVYNSKQKKWNKVREKEKKHKNDS
ncbi:serine/threonineprotein kinase [Pelomyxa schiedti]|nr:serine/threonineprotein kinase [Pelomyxa schiedti]